MDAAEVAEVPCPTCSLDPRTQRVVQAGMVAWISVVAFESLAVSTAMPTVAVALDGLRWYTLAFSGSAAASVVGMLAAGRWTDRRGPAAPMTAGAAIFVPGLLAAALAPSWAVLLAGRLLQGVGGGLTGVALYVLVARVFPAQRHPRVFAAFAAAWVVPGVVGPLLAGLVVEHAGWRWVFGGVVLLALPTLALMRPGLAAARGSDGATPAAASPARSVARTVLRARRGLGAAVVVRVLASAAFAAGEVLIPLVLVHERGLAPAAAGSVLTLSVLGWAAGSAVRGRRRGLSNAGYLRLGGLLLAAGTAGVALLAAPGVSLWLAAAPWALAGLGMGLIYPTLSILALELAPPGGQGAASSAMQVADALAVAAALAVVGQALWALRASLGLAAYAVCFAAAGVVALLAAAQTSRTRTAR
ncbi:MFS transporter [Xylanimonas sp. McL0601]|uniref:MFS transporter n=1 Tax=Xylanimonas sp. McL0601 TaxID=3414739 RepID=UPI003CE91676